MSAYFLRTQRALLHGMPPVQSPPAAPSVLNDLRAGTHTLHVALEQRLPFFSDTLDLEYYTCLLSAYFGFYQALEDRLTHSAFIPSGFDLAARLKTPALVQDLRALGVDPHALPRCQHLPTVRSEAQALGVLYVLEGATLGGNVLRKRVAEHLGLDADNGGAFLFVYGEDTGQHWKAFIEFLGSVPLDATGRSEAAQAACSTFSCFEQWLDRQEVLL